MKYLLTLILISLYSFTLLAQAPQAFNYQGVARNLSGSPIPNQEIGLQIAILQGSSTGTESYKETHLVSTNDLGLFNIAIGTGTVVNGVFENVDWANGTHFVQIELDETGGSDFQLIGTSQLLSVPYAMNAGNAYWEKTGNDIFYENGHVSVGSGPTNSLVNIEAEGDLYNIGSGSNFTDQKAPLVITQSGTSPSGNGRSILIDANQIDQAKEDAGLYLNGASSSTLIVNRGGGNVGIGNNVFPQSILHIVEDEGDAALIIEADPNDNNEESNPRIEFLQDGGYANSSIGVNLFEDGNDNGLYIANTTSANGGIHLATDDTPSGWTTASIRMSIATDGNVGIGVTEPKSKLQVSNGDIYIEDVNNGVIMKSPNGQCWRYTPDNSGQLTGTMIACPN